MPGVDTSLGAMGLWAPEIVQLDEVVRVRGAGEAPKDTPDPTLWVSMVLL